MTSNHKKDVTGMSRLVSNVVTSWLSQISMIITGFFLPRIISDQLGQEVLGLWDLAWSLVAYISLANLGIGSSLNRFVSNYIAESQFEKLRTATSTVVVIQFIISTLVVLIVLACVYYLPQLYSGPEETVATAQWVVFLLGLSIASQFLFDTSRGVLTGCHRWDIHNALNAGTNVVCSLLMIGALMLGKGLVAISAIYFLCVSVEGVARSYMSRRVCPEAKWEVGAVSLKFSAEILRFGSSLFVLGLIPIIANQTTSILIATTFGPSVLAVFARPNALMRVLRSFVTRFTYVLTPMAGPILLKEGPEKLEEFLISTTTYSFAMTLPPTILFCLYGDELIGLWMGSDYVNSVLVLILGLGVLLRLALNPSIRILIGLDLHGRIALAGLALTLFIFVVGVPVIHHVGASLEAYACLLSISMTLVYGLVIPVYACRRMGVPFVSYLLKSVKPVLPITAAATLLLFVIESVAEESIVVRAVNIVVYGIMTLMLYWRFLIPEEKKVEFFRSFSNGER